MKPLYLIIFVLALVVFWSVPWTLIVLPFLLGTEGLGVVFKRVKTFAEYLKIKLG